MVGLAIPWNRPRALLAATGIIVLSVALTVVARGWRADYQLELEAVKAEALMMTDAIVTHPDYPTVVGWYSGRPYTFLPMDATNPS